MIAADYANNVDYLKRMTKAALIELYLAIRRDYMRCEQDRDTWKRAHLDLEGGLSDQASVIDDLKADARKLVSKNENLIATEISLRSQLKDREKLRWAIEREVERNNNLCKALEMLAGNARLTAGRIEEKVLATSLQKPSSPAGRGPDPHQPNYEGTAIQPPPMGNHGR